MSMSSEITQLEAAFTVRLPAAYRSLLTSYPEALENKDKDNPRYESISDLNLLNDPQAIRQLNVEEREFWPDTDYAHVPLPDSYFFIGTDGCGNLFAIDTAITDSCPVFELDHENAEWNCCAKSLDDFIAWLVKELLE